MHTIVKPESFIWMCVYIIMFGFAEMYIFVSEIYNLIIIKTWKIGVVNIYCVRVNIVT